MNTIIVEDEKLAAERLQLLLEMAAPGVMVNAVIDTVEDSIAWLKTHPAPDFILLDIHLADGSAFELFRHLNIVPPVIFTTAYDRYALDAFKVLSIDYLLKPVTVEALSGALQKLRTLRKPAIPSADYAQLLQLMQELRQPYKTRFLGRVGQKLFFIDAGDIAYFLADNKIVYLQASDGNRYIIEHTMETLEKMLDPILFFRINRSVIVKATAIDQVKPYLNSRLKVICNAGKQTTELIVSREKVNNFKIWADS